MKELRSADFVVKLPQALGGCKFNSRLQQFGDGRKDINDHGVPKLSVSLCIGHRDTENTFPEPPRVSWRVFYL
ncbi:hypothetical protein MY017_45760 (plasmid) [Escherichia coli]|nr:hypothetical protein MY017_45760 [Escherichia coli]